MITQYSGNSSISTQIQNLIANKVSLLDQYILMQTGQYEYSALVYNPNTKKCVEYTITRDSNNYNTFYEINEKESNFDYAITNEYYVYSNIGYGSALELPVYQGVISHSLIIIACVLLFGIIFKGALFKCLRK